MRTRGNNFQTVHPPGFVGMGAEMSKNTTTRRLKHQAGIGEPCVHWETWIGNREMSAWRCGNNFFSINA